MKRNIVKKAFPMLFAAFMALVVGSASMLAAAAPATAQRPSAVVEGDGSLAMLLAEVSQRINGSPLQVFELLAEALLDGVFAVDFSLPDLLSGRVEMHSDMENQDFALLANVSVPLMGIFNFDVDAAVLVNNDRIAVGSSLLGDVFYGLDLTGDVMAELSPFLQMLGLTPRDIRDLTEMLDLFTFNMNVPEFDLALLLPYIAFVNDFINGLNPTVTQVSGVTRTVYTVTAADLARTFGRLATMLENDRALRNFSDTLFGEQERAAQNAVAEARLRELVYDMYTHGQFNNEFYAGMSFEEILAEFFLNNHGPRTVFDTIVVGLRYAAEDFQEITDPANNKSLVMRLEVDTATSGRINRMALDFEYVQYRAVSWCRETRTNIFAYRDESFTAVLDLGTSVNNTWTLTVQEADQSWGESAIRFDWFYIAVGANHTNRINVVPTNPSSFPVAFFSQWNTATGAFTLGFEETNRSTDVVTTYDFSGNFLVRPDNTFVLALPQFNLAFSTEMGAKIPAVTSFTSFSELDLTGLLGMLEAFLP